MRLFEALPDAHATERGPFDVIGDVHGCLEELRELLEELGYGGVATAGWAVSADDPPRHGEGRRAVFVGDLTDRGPASVGTVQLVWQMYQAGVALLAPGNHDSKILRYLWGRPVRLTHGAETTAAELHALPSAEQARFRSALEVLVGEAPPYLILDRGRLVVAHAGIRGDMIGDRSRRTVDFVLYGDTNGDVTSDGFPVRRDWAMRYRGDALVVYGHTPVREPEFRHNTINIDTGCVFGGKLTALRYPERELIAVPSAHTYAERARPFLPVEAQAPVLSAQHENDDILDLEDVLGKRLVETRLNGKVTIREENATAALEVMSR